MNSRRLIKRTDYLNQPVATRPFAVVRVQATNLFPIAKKEHKKWLSLAITPLVIAVLAFQFVLIPQPKLHAEVKSVGPNSPASGANCSNDSSAGGSQSWSSVTNAAASDDARSGVSIGFQGSNTTSYYLKCVNFGFNIPIISTVKGIEVTVERQDQGSGPTGTHAVVKNNTIAGSIGGSAWPDNVDGTETLGSSSELWGTTWHPTDINATNFGAAVRATNFLSSTNAFVDSMTVTVYYEVNPVLNQMGYIWENDDEDQATGDAYDQNSSQASANAAISNVRKGERLALRTQLKNVSQATFNQELGLFYDKNGDGNFIRAGSPVPVAGAGNCGTGNAWACEQVQDTANSVNVGTYSSLAISPNGVPYITYIDDGASDDLWVAFYVGIGGNCGPSNTWRCNPIQTTSQIGQYTSIAFHPQGGEPWVTYFDDTNDDLRVARFVGAGGSGCASAAWSCGTIDDSNAGSYNAIAFGTSGEVYVAYHHIGNASLRIAQYVGTGGGCSGSGNQWNCGAIEAGESGAYLSMAVDTNGVIYISWLDYTGFVREYDLRVAKYVGTGGNCVFNSQFSCSTVDSTGDTGFDTSIAISPDNTPYVTYYDDTNDNLRLAYYVGGTGGDCTADSAWECVTIDANNDVGRYSSIAFSPSGAAYISYNYTTSNHTRLARYVGSGGNCDSASYGGTADADAWECTDIATSNGGDHTSIAFDANGVPYVSWRGISSDDLRMAKLARGGDISLAVPMGGGHGDSLTTAKVGGSCIGGGSFSNGKLYGVDTGQTVQLSPGNCTEIEFVIDTSQATEGATYRFIVASADGHRFDKGKWRGMGAISQYATMTISSGTDFKASKGFEIQGLGSCTNSAWTCETLAVNNAVGGWTASIAMSPTGTPYAAFYKDDTSDDLYVAQYVGSGGTCDNIGGSDAWQCTLVDATGVVGQEASIAISQAGVAYVSYRSASAMKVAQYVGSGGNCDDTGGSDAWQCTVVDGMVGYWGDIAISPAGVPYLSYYDGSGLNLRLAYYDGDSVASGCTGGSNAWTCGSIDTTGDTGGLSSIAISPTGIPYIAYVDFTNSTLRLAFFDGDGTSSGCAITPWTCVTIDSSVQSSNFPSVEISPAGVPYISYQKGAATLMVANYDGDTTPSGCTNNGWTCTTLDTSGTTSGNEGLAFGPAGNPYIVYGNSLKVAYYDGDSTPSGCTGGSNAWTCVAVNTGTNYYSQSIAFNPAGVPYVVYASNGSILFAKPRNFTTGPKTSTLNSFGMRNARFGFGQYRLSNGQSPRSNTEGLCGSGVSNYLGICALYDDGGHMDSITVLLNERPVFNFSQRFSSNSQLPSAAWAGRSSLAPSTGGTEGDIVLQVYRFGSTNAWETIATNSSSANCNTDNCYLKGIPGGTINEYYEVDGSNYWIHWRVWQNQNTSGSTTFRTDLFQLQFISDQMRHGRIFEDNLERPFTF